MIKNTKQFFHTTFEVFKIYWEIAPWLTLGVLVTRIIMNLQGIVNAYVFASILDKLIFFVSKAHATTKELIPMVLLIALVSLFFTLVTSIDDYFNSLLVNQDQYKLRLKQTDFIQSLGMLQMENPELTNKVTRYGEVYHNMNQHLSISIALVSVFVSVLISGGVILTFQPLLIMLFIALFIFKYINNTRYRNKIWNLTREHTEQRRNAWTSAGVLAEPAYIKELIISGGASFLRRKFVNFTSWFYKEYFRLRTHWSIFEMIQSILDGLLFGIGIFIVIEKGISGAITVGAITFYIRALGTFSDQIDTLSYRISRVAESGIRIHDALELFEIYKPDEDGKSFLQKSKIAPTIKLENISFTYPSGFQAAIQNISLTIKPGEKIAIVGENGAGKTTLVKLITRIYRVNQGKIKINEIPLDEIAIKSWYRKLGVLFQDFNTYGHLTVGENIGIGKIENGGFNEEKVISSLKKADALDFIDRYPKKLDQLLSERFKGGIRPSGGQWQKIAIARFFYRNAPVLILDEPTASIDAVSEAQIFDNIYKFIKNKTVIIISHRFSTVRNADRILVLDKGKIIEEGSHEELLKKKGKYAKAFKLQAKGYE